MRLAGTPWTTAANRELSSFDTCNRRTTGAKSNTKNAKIVELSVFLQKYTESACAKYEAFSNLFLNAPARLAGGEVTLAGARSKQLFSLPAKFQHFLSRSFGPFSAGRTDQFFSPLQPHPSSGTAGLRPLAPGGPHPFQEGINIVRDLAVGKIFVDFNRGRSHQGRRHKLQLVA